MSDTKQAAVAVVECGLRCASSGELEHAEEHLSALSSLRFTTTHAWLAIKVWLGKLRQTGDGAELQCLLLHNLAGTCTTMCSKEGASKKSLKKLVACAGAVKASMTQWFKFHEQACLCLPHLDCSNPLLATSDGSKKILECGPPYACIPEYARGPKEPPDSIGVRTRSKEGKMKPEGDASESDGEGAHGRRRGKGGGMLCAAWKR